MECTAQMADRRVRRAARACARPAWTTRVATRRKNTHATSVVEVPSSSRGTSTTVSFLSFTTMVTEQSCSKIQS